MLVFDYTENCRIFLQYQNLIVEMIWWVGIVRNIVCVFCFFSIILTFRKLAKVGPKNGNCEGSAVQDIYKIRTTSARRNS